MPIPWITLNRYDYKKFHFKGEFIENEIKM